MISKKQKEGNCISTVEIHLAGHQGDALPRAF